MVEHDALALLLRQFTLSGLHARLEELEERAQAGSWSYRQYLRELLESEAAVRAERRLVRLLKESSLPEGKTLAVLDQGRLSQQNRRQLARLVEGHWIDRHENVLAFGLPGRGKTHFLSAVAHELILRQQRRVLFVSCFKLIQRLLEAKQSLQLEKALKKLERYEVIILDDIGYVHHSREEMEVLFTFFAERYERASLMVSSNLVFSQWEKIFHDPMTAMAAIDRLVHHSVLLEFTGESQRTPKTTKNSP